MTHAAVQATRNGQLLIDSDHPDATHIIHAIQPYGRIVAYTGRFVRMRINRDTLWSAAAQGLTSADLIATIRQACHEQVDTLLIRGIETIMRRWGMLTMYGGVADVHISCAVDVPHSVHALLCEQTGTTAPTTVYAVPATQRGIIKTLLWHKGWPVDDRASIIDGDLLDIHWSDRVQLRPYQHQACTAACQSPDSVIALPPGSGKTYIGVAVMCAIQRHTLIITPSRTAAQQWLDSIVHASDAQLERTVQLAQRQRPATPITIATYQQLIANPDTWEQREWGLIIYDEVHMLPAPVFRTTAKLQARRRLGLSATLIREDGRIGDVFSLVGPQRYTVPWRTLEHDGYLAPVVCTEVSVRQSDDERATYMASMARHQGRLAALCSAKLRVVQRIAAQYPTAPLLVIGQYIEQLQALADMTGWPFVHGGTAQELRTQWFAQFRNGEIPRLIVSKVANQALDLPNAQILVQISGSYGSRQEEAQRLGRVLRPQAGKQARFFSVITRQTREVDDAWKRQQFLRAQGYTYQQLSEEEL